MTHEVVVFAGAVLAGYLIGGIPFGFIIGKCRGVDVRTVGSGNIGATNVYRTVGHAWGFLAFFCDFLKGLLPALCASLFLVPENASVLLKHLPMCVGFACVLGHTLTPYMRFRGGKGVATAFGMLIALLTYPVLIAFAVFVLTVWLSHYISLGSCVAALTVAVLAWAFPDAWMLVPATLPLKILVTLIGVFVIVKHRTNLVRLRDGTENKIW